MARISSSQSIGQLLIIGFEGVELSSATAGLLRRVQPAGVILFARNIETAQQTHKLLKDCQACVSLPLFTCVDLEGGKVDRLREAIGPTPAAAEVFATTDRRLYRKHGRIIGQNCRALGFNCDLAPVLDLAFEVSKRVMSSRAVSSDPKKTVVYAREFLVGLKSAGVIGCGKHFPGLGEASLDTHFDLPRVRKSFKQMREEDIAPYRMLRSRLPMVLISHATYSAVTPDDTPASLSKKWITDVLRKRLGYRGLVLSDDLEMGGVLKAAPIEEAAIGFVRAGGDLCLVCHEEKRVLRSYDALLEAVANDKRFSRRAEDSITRVIAFKRRSAALMRAKAAPTQSKVDQLSRQLWEFAEEVRYKTIERENLQAHA